MGNRNNINNKTLDLSQPFRLSGLSSGAKLQLVVLSRSPSVVSVALQLPDSEASSSNRVTGKFSATTTFWLLLRHFESGPTNSKQSRNLTARGIMQVQTGESNCGRLFYEIPVIQVMGRELASFTDLQKSLAQLGFNSGSVLLRLSFRLTKIPFEEAIKEIDSYFKSTEDEQVHSSQSASTEQAESAPLASRSLPPASDTEPHLLPERSFLSQPESSPQESTPLLSTQLSRNDATPRPNPNALRSDIPPNPDEVVSGPAERPISVFAPSPVPTLAASRQLFNDKDYEPTIAHAKLHQARLATSTVNKRLPTDAELANKAEAQARRRGDVTDVQIKFRFPDQMQVVSTFSKLDTTATLHDFVKGLMEKEDEPFSLNFSSVRGPMSLPKEGNLKLISDLGMTGRMLVNVAWDSGASTAIRGRNVLKPEFQMKAKQIEVKENEGVEMEEQREKLEDKGKRRDEGRDRKGSAPRWLKLGKK